MFRHSLDEHSELRLLELRQAETLFRLVDDNRSYLRAWLPWVDATRSPEDSREFIESSRRQLARDAGFSAGIWHRDRLAGVIGFHSLDRVHRVTSIGYWLDAGHQGKGLVTRACHALVRHALVDLELNRVEVRAATANHRSRAVAERLGFRLEGVLRDAEWLCDRYVDHAVYGMLARDFLYLEARYQGERPRSPANCQPGVNSVVRTDDELSSWC